MNKVIDKGFRSCRFVSTIVKHPVKVTLGPSPSLYFRFSILLVFSSFFAFFGVFVGDLGFWYSYPHPDSPSFLRVFLRVASNPPTVGSGPTGCFTTLGLFLTYYF